MDKRFLPVEETEEPEWTFDCDMKLIRIIKRLGENWDSVSWAIGGDSFNPTEKQCRRRWFDIMGDNYEDREEIYQEILENLVPTYEEDMAREENDDDESDENL